MKYNFRPNEFDAVIYGVNLLSYYKQSEIYSPCGTLCIELLNLVDEGAGVTLSIDWVGPTHRNVFSAHWLDDQLTILNYDKADATWITRLEDWYDRIRAAARLQLPATCSGSAADGEAQLDSSESGQRPLDLRARRAARSDRDLPDVPVRSDDNPT